MRDLDDAAAYSADWNLGRRVFGEDAVLELTAAVLAAPVPARRHLAAFAARQALRAVGLEDHPDLAATLADLDALDRPAKLTPAAAAFIRKGLAIPDDVKTPPSHCALIALQRTTEENSSAAALDATWRAAYTLRSTDPQAAPCYYRPQSSCCAVEAAKGSTAKCRE